MVFDDYGFPSCPGRALQWTKIFVTGAYPLVLPTGQAMRIKSE